MSVFADFPSVLLPTLVLLLRYTPHTKISQVQAQLKNPMSKLSRRWSSVLPPLPCADGWRMAVWNIGRARSREGERARVSSLHIAKTQCCQIRLLFLLYLPPFEMVYQRVHRQARLSWQKGAIRTGKSSFASFRVHTHSGKAARRLILHFFLPVSFIRYPDAREGGWRKGEKW